MRKSYETTEVYERWQTLTSSDSLMHMCIFLRKSGLISLNPNIKMYQKEQSALADRDSKWIERNK